MADGAHSRLRDDIRGLPRGVWAICGGTLVSKLGNFLNVFIVLYVQRLTGEPRSVVVALAVFGVGNVVGTILGGWAADALGARKTLAGALIISGVAIAVVPAAPDFAVLCVMLAVAGTSAQVVRPAAGALLVRMLPDEHRLTAFTLLRLGVNLGTAVGPAAGGLLATTSFTALFIVNGIVNVAYALIVLKWVGRSQDRSHETRTGAGADRGSVKTRGYGAMVRDPSFMVFLVGVLFASVVYTQSTSVLPLKMARVGLSTATFGFMLTLNAVLVIACEFPVMRWLRRLPRGPVMAVGTVVLGAGIAASGLCHSTVGFAATVVVWTLGEIIYTPFSTTYPAVVAPLTAIGAYQGAESFSSVVGAAIGPVLGSALFSLASWAPWVAALACSVVGALAYLWTSSLRGRMTAPADSAPLDETSAG